MTHRIHGLDTEPDRRALRIMEALSGVDETLLERCEWKGKAIDYKGRIRRRVWKTGGGCGCLWKDSKAWAAVLCLAVVGTVSWGGYQLTRGVVGNDASGSGNAEAYQLQSMTIEDAAPEAGEAEMAAEGREESGMRGDVSTNLNGAAADSGGAADDNMAPAAGLPAEGSQESAKQQAMEKQESEATEDQEYRNETDFGSERLQEEVFAEADARAVEKLGDYVPTALPEGYVFEHAFRDLNAEEAKMSVYWSRGMDEIGLYIVEGREETVTVDVSRPETYDERLYEIPYAETVPAEYREFFDDPVFALEDFSLEIVKSRMIAREDRGDTDTPRGNFSVLYPDGVLVRFNGRGTAEEIWELFDSIRIK